MKVLIGFMVVSFPNSMWHASMIYHRSRFLRVLTFVLFNNMVSFQHGEHSTLAYFSQNITTVAFCDQAQASFLDRRISEWSISKHCQYEKKVALGLQEYL